MRKFLGWLFLLLPIIALFITMFVTAGVNVGLTVLTLLVAMSICALIGVKLLDDE